MMPARVEITEGLAVNSIAIISLLMAIS